MKKITWTILFIFLFNVTTVFAAGFYICKNNNCAMYVIEDTAGFSWTIECTDGTSVTGRTNGASYGGPCEKVV